MPDTLEGLSQFGSKLDHVARAVDDVRERLTRLETRLDGAPAGADLDKRLSLVEGALGRIETSQEKQGERIGRVEEAKAVAQGAEQGRTGQRSSIQWVLAVLVALASLAAAWGWIRPGG